MRFFKAILCAVIVATSAVALQAQTFSNPLLEKKEPWSKKQLIEPSELVRLMSSNPSAKLVIFNIGVVEDIKGARKVDWIDKGYPLKEKSGA